MDVLNFLLLLLLLPVPKPDTKVVEGLLGLRWRWIGLVPGNGCQAGFVYAYMNRID